MAGYYLPMSQRARASIPMLSRCLTAGLVYLFIFGLPAKILADELKYLGITFDVDELAEVDDKTTRVKLFNEEMIVASVSVGEIVAKKYLSDPENLKKIPIGSLEEFIEQALAGKKNELATLALQAYFSHPSRDITHDATLFRSIFNQYATVGVLKKLISSDKVNDSDAKARILYNIALRDPNWIRKNKAGLLYTLSENIKRITKEAFNYSVKSRSLEDARSSLTVIRNLYGSNNTFLNDLTGLYSKFKTIEAARSNHSIEQIFSIIEQSKSDPELDSMFGTELSSIIHDSASRALKGGDRVKALRILSHLNLDRRTPTSFSIAHKSVKQLAFKDRSLLEDSAVTNALIALSGYDNTFKKALINYLYKTITTLQANKDSSSALKFISIFQKLSPQDIHALQLKQALLYVKQRRFHSAERIIQSDDFKLSFTDRIRLFLGGYYVNLPILLAYISIPFLLFGIIRLRTLRLRAQALGHDSSEFYDTISSVGDRIKSSRLSPRYQEYSRCLQIFELPATATEKDIKAAYRAAVKEVHPDIIGNNQEEHDSDDFIRLTQTYERMLELRKELGLK